MVFSRVTSVLGSMAILTQFHAVKSSALRELSASTQSHCALFAGIDRSTPLHHRSVNSPGLCGKLQ
jgi:hypothetical protein